MYSGANCEEQFKFMYRVLVVTTKAKTADLEKGLEIKKYREGNLGVVVLVVKHMSRPLVVLEIHRGGSDAVGQNGAHDHHAKLR